MENILISITANAADGGEDAAVEALEALPDAAEDVLAIARAVYAEWYTKPQADTIFDAAVRAYIASLG